MHNFSPALTFLYSTSGLISLAIAVGFSRAFYFDYVLGQCNRRRNIGLIGGMAITWSGSALHQLFLTWQALYAKFGGMFPFLELSAGIGAVVPLAGKLMILVGAIIHLETLVLNRKWGRSTLLFVGVASVLVGLGLATLF